jgi:hypothetical protein
LTPPSTLYSVFLTPEILSSEVSSILDFSPITINSPAAVVSVIFLFVGSLRLVSGAVISNVKLDTFVSSAFPTLSAEK